MELTKEVSFLPVATPKPAAGDDGGEETVVHLVYVNRNLQWAVFLGYNTVMTTQHCEKENLAQALYETPKKMAGATTCK